MLMMRMRMRREEGGTMLGWRQMLATTSVKALLLWLDKEAWPLNRW